MSSSFGLYTTNSYEVINVLDNLGLDTQGVTTSNETLSSFVLTGTLSSPGSIFVSPDGILWFPAADNPFTGALCVNACSNTTTILAVGGEDGGLSDTIAYSYNGYNWTLATNNPFAGIGFGSSCAWSPALSLFVVSASNSTAINTSLAYSVDNGKNWLLSPTQVFAGGTCEAVCWSQPLSLFVAGGKNTGSVLTVAYSSDGKNWTQANNSPFPGGFTKGLYWCQDLSIFIAGGKNSTGSVTLAYSTDGKTWSQANNNPFTSGLCNAITWSTDLKLFVAVGKDGSSNVWCATSSDGKNWIAGANRVFDEGTGVTYGNKTFVASGNNVGQTTVVMTSFDGINWYETPDQPSSSGSIGAVVNTNVPIPVVGIEGNKTFIIDHPLDPQNRYLIHACIEGPENGVYYRGTGITGEDKTVEVILPGYVSTLAMEFTVHVSHIYIEPSDLIIFPYLTSTDVIDGKFTVSSNKPLCSFNWLVIAKRGNLDTEVLKSEVKVHGDGPYKYL